MLELRFGWGPYFLYEPWVGHMGGPVELKVNPYRYNLQFDVVPIKESEQRRTPTFAL